MIIPIDGLHSIKHQHTQARRMTKLIALKRIFRFNAFSPTEKSDEIITANEKTIMHIQVTAVVV